MIATVRGEGGKHNFIFVLIALSTFTPNNDKETRLLSQNCEFMGSIYEQVSISFTTEADYPA